jgi:ABC-type transport system involved in multi-copper enzyme maturation permease subunit
MKFDNFPCTEIYQNMLLTLAIEFAFTSFFVFLCTSLRNTGGFVLSLMLDTIVNMVASLVVMFVGSKKLANAFEIAVPSLQRNDFAYDPTNVPSNIWWMILIDIGICFVITIAGIEIFKRADLK